MLAGELYLHKEGGRTRSFDMTAALDDKSAAIYFAAFDLLSLDGEDYLWILRHWTKSLTLCCLQGNLTCGKKQLCRKQKRHCCTLYKEIVEDGGQEGIVVRSHNGPTYKIKPLITLDAVILGYAEGAGKQSWNAQRSLGGLVCGKR